MALFYLLFPYRPDAARAKEVRSVPTLALKRWGLDGRNLLFGSVIPSQEPSFWESYRRYAVAGGIVVAAQTAAIVALLWQWKRRRKVQEALQKSEEKFSRTFRNAPMAVTLTSASDNRYIDVNETFEAITGWTRSEVIGRTPTELGVWVNPQQKYDQVSRLLAGTSLQNMEFFIRTKSGQLRTVLTASDLVEVNNETCVVSIGSDITDLKRAQDSIRESEERFRLVANTAPVMIWMTGTDKLCSYVNQTWLAFTGRCLNDELGNGWVDGIFAEDVEGCLKVFTMAFDRREPFEMEYRVRRHDGEYRWIFDLGVPRFHADGSFAGYIGSCIDVTERRLAEEALSSVSRKLIEAHEEERTWIARELHDDVNQRLALLAVNLDVLNGELPSSATNARRHTAEIKQQVKELGIDVQALSHRLHSSKLEYLGLSAAAGAFCREFSERKGVQIDFSSENVPRSLAEETSLCLFRVLQEALQNAVKHSGSEHYRVSITCDSDEVVLTVSDSGCGFNTEEALRTPGLGLTSMRERTKIVHGDLVIDSRKNGGTMVRAIVPMHTNVSLAKVARA
jgi:PAS domain S-box-containing protein